MEMNIKQYFLVERDSNSQESCLIKNYGNGFNRGGTPQSAHKFSSEEDAKTSCTVQNTLATIFGNNTFTYYVEETITRVKKQDNGTELAEETQA
ncbi:hypothetical protein [Mammaliicoccus vitulinus]|uniref:Uncharacterized protein n=1 Tax=Mammaliicoccus vitulinus TaxID=71237 RepID=A0ABX7HES9_9STAP|nr:hypothetical protein [Mammaliicoccus vitulinus]PNZ38988.1 hypothetical protein CD107_05800 [Mammaliicoccus vitulinus]QRO85116.1 hypothetical protein I6J37_13220 [Mammaliicoccus vitulinus]